jgi:hypothetical protein
VARIRVVLNHRGGVPYVRPEDRLGAVFRIPLDRLLVRLTILPPGEDPDVNPDELVTAWRPLAILDTGAPLSIFPHRMWQPFAPAIQWLAQPPTAVRQVTVLGGTWSYRLGRVRTGATDPEGRWLPAVWVNAFFLEPAPGAPPEAVLGLRCRLLDNRRLRQEAAPSGGVDRTWWLEAA